jgi:hypothetical protein
MPDFPAQCPDCGTIFPFRGIGVGKKATLKIGIGSDVGAICPKCKSPRARVSEGLFSANSTAIEIISAPESTHAALAALKAIAEQAAAGKISKTEELDPRYGSLLERYFNLDMPTLAVLISLLGIYINHHDSVSSSDDMKGLLNAATEQTYILKQGFDRIAPARQQVEKKRHHFEKPTHRRAWVNYERRKRMRLHRQQFGGARTH